MDASPAASAPAGVAPTISLRQRVKLLNRIPAFAALPADVREVIAGLMHEERYPPDTVIVAEGQIGERVYLVVEASASVYVERDGREETIATLTAGDLFGEAVLLSDVHHHEAGVVAITPVHLLALSNTAFESLLGRYPRVRDVFRAHVGRSSRRWLASHLLYAVHFQDLRRELLFLSSVSFFLTFLVVRAIVNLIRAGVGPFHNVSAGGTHIHHLVWGILLLLFVGYALFLQVNLLQSGQRRHWIRLTAVLYGVGAALTLDEFVLWLKLADLYFSPQGQESVHAVFLFGSLLLIGVWGGSFFGGLYHFLLRKHPTRVRV
ncbi:MAG TPA: cyclic nucleotide-binding domain-containing protein [Chloroflexota bacterium]|nr:cyclic nucleotide-binding domain-containing protein [Chloroflexota bacterium]